MKKYFENPELELLKFEVQDVITTSGLIDDGEDQDIDTPL